MKTAVTEGWSFWEKLVMSRTTENIAADAQSVEKNPKVYPLMIIL